MGNQENLVEITADSKVFREATKCFKVPQKYFNDFFSEIIKQNGLANAFSMIHSEVTIRECFKWEDSDKGGQFWSDVEDEMLLEAGIMSEKRCNKDKETKTSERIEDLAAIHSDIKELLNLLRNR